MSKFVATKMRPVLEDIAELRAKLSANANEHELLEIIAQKLSGLRASYRQHKKDFTPEIVDFLKNVALLKMRFGILLMRLMTGLRCALEMILKNLLRDFKNS